MIWIPTLTSASEPCLGWGLVDTPQELVFKINEESLDHISHLSRAEVVRAIIAAAHKLNEQTPGVWVRYGGITSHGKQEVVHECGQHDFDYDILVRVVEGYQGAGVVASRCNGEILGDIRLGDSSNPNWDWSLGRVDNPNVDMDILATVMHEFGHVAGLHHPSEAGSNAKGVMAGNPGAGTLRRQDWYPYDVECFYEEVGARSRDIYEWSMEYGSFTYEDYHQASGYARGVPVMAPDATIPPIRGAFSIDNALGWWGGSNEEFINEADVSVALRYGAPISDYSKDRVFFSKDDSSYRYEWGSRRIHYYYQSDDGFETYGSRYGYIVSSSCGSWACLHFFLRTSNPPSVTYDTSGSDDFRVKVWSREDRLDEEYSRSIRMEVKREDGTQTSIGYVTGDQGERLYSRFGPQVACGPLNSAPGNNTCVLAYVSFYDDEYGAVHRYQIHTVPFSLDVNGEPDFEWSEEISIGHTSYTGFALWHSGAHWWFASQAPKNVTKDETPTYAFRAPANGSSFPWHWDTTWHQNDSGYLGESITVPRVVTTRYGDIAQLFLTR